MFLISAQVVVPREDVVSYDEVQELLYSKVKVTRDDNSPLRATGSGTILLKKYTCNTIKKYIHVIQSVNFINL